MFDYNIMITNDRNHRLLQVPESIEFISQLSKNDNLEQNSETVKTPGKVKLKNSDLRCAEVTVLNMEVETLRWQLAQVYLLEFYIGAPVACSNNLCDTAWRSYLLSENYV